MIFFPIYIKFKKRCTAFDLDLFFQNNWHVIYLKVYNENKKLINESITNKRDEYYTQKEIIMKYIY